MKISIAIAACCAACLVAGCESSSDFSDSIHSVLTGKEDTRSRVFQADQKATYMAARAAVDQLGYRFVRGGPAEGKIDALSGISGGDEAGSSRQISLKVRLDYEADAGTTVTIQFSEIIEADSSNQPGMATETPMRDTPLYEVFFRNLQQALQAPPTAMGGASK
jgi:hypothetical protein